MQIFARKYVYTYNVFIDAMILLEVKIQNSQGWELFISDKFFFLAVHVAYEISQVRDQTWSAAVTYATAVAMPDP